MSSVLENGVPATGSFPTNRPFSAANKVQVIEADDLIKYRTYHRGGGAHPDIFRADNARMLWRLIQQYAP